MAHERNRRSLWRVLGIYAAASWISLQVVDVLTQNMGLSSASPTNPCLRFITGLRLRPLQQRHEEGGF